MTDVGIFYTQKSHKHTPRGVFSTPQRSLPWAPRSTTITATAVESLDRRLKLTLLTLGAGRAQILFSTLWEARFSLMLAGVAAYGRIVSEVGISLMIGGNIKWHTRTITTAIALETGKGDFAMGIALGLVLMMIAIVVNLFVVRLRKRS